MTEPFPGELVATFGDEYTSFARREPAVLTHLLSGPIAGLVTLFAPGHPGSAANQITAGVVAFALVVQGFLVRRFVAPAWKQYSGHPLPEIAPHPHPHPTPGGNRG